MRAQCRPSFHTRWTRLGVRCRESPAPRFTLVSVSPIGPASHRRTEGPLRTSEGSICKPMKSVVALVYVVVGFFVAGSQGYLLFDTLQRAVSAGAAILLWPLLFFGVDLHFGA